MSGPRFGRRVFAVAGIGAGLAILVVGTLLHSGAFTIVTGNGQSAVPNGAVVVNPTVLVKDQNNNPLPGQAITFAPVGEGSVTGGTVTTDASGLAHVNSWTLGSTVKVDTLKATLTSPGGISGSTLTFTATVVAADTPTAIAVTRDVGSQAGGTTLDVRGRLLDPGITVTVGGVPATGVTWKNSTRVTFTTPPGTVGYANVVVSQGGLSSTLSNAFEYVDSAIVVFAKSTFSGGGGTLAPFTVIGTVALSTDFIEPGGDHSAKATASGNSSAESSLQLALPADSLTFLTARGAFFHYYILIPDATFSQITGQIKLSLCRDNNSASGEWGHLGIGPQVASPPVATDAVSPVSLGMVNTPGGANYLPGGHPGVYFTSNRWMEVLLYMKRTSGVSGTIRTWQGTGGMLKRVTVDGSDSDPANGLDSTVAVYQYRVGAVFNQGNVSAANNLLVYLGDLMYADGVPDGF